MYVWDIQSATLLARLSLPVPAAALNFSADSGLLVVGAGGQLLVWESAAWNPIATLNLPGGTVIALEFSPDGTQFACGASDGSVTIWGVR